MAELRLSDENFIPPSESSAGPSTASSVARWRVVVDEPVDRAAVQLSETWPALGAPLAPRRFPSRESIEDRIATNFASCRGDDETPASVRYRAIKRTIDMLVSATLLVVLSPVLVLVALLVKLDSRGPALFVQQRVGQFGRIFPMFKFRTMYAGQVLMLEEPVHKLAADPRVTRVGAFLRSTSLDELPQLLNVLRGDMSLVGPRPEIPEIALKYYQPWQYRRLLVPQGMTGWWQINGRGTRLMREHTEDDLFYVDHTSTWLDLKILLLTVRAVLRREGAF